MNTILTTVLTFFIVIIVNLTASSQTNSVTLKDGGGTIINQYNSIQAAYDAIPGTISQAYIIEIESIYTGANETVPINFTVRTGSSASNTITLRPAAGNTGETISGSSTNSILRIDGANYIIIDGRPGGTGSTVDLIMQNTASSGSNAHTIEISNSASNNVIRYVHLQNGTANAAGPRTIEIGPATSGAGNDNNLIEYCEIEGGRSGVGLAGSSGFINDGNIIRNCKIYNFGYAGIWILSYSENTTIVDNELYSTMPASTSTIFSGIAIGATAGATTDIYSNKIYNLQSASTATGLDVRGIFFQGNVPDGSTFNIVNNFVALPLNNNNTAATIGIELDGSGNSTYNVFNNSIRIGGTQSGGSGVVSACIYNEVDGASSSVNITNNACVNNRTGGGGSHAGGWYQELGAILNINYNVYYVDGTGGVNAFWGAAPYTNIANYKSAASPQEQNSVFENVTFVSATDLHLAGGSIGDTLLKGTPLAGVTEDIDGDPRNPIAPYKGADEGSIVLLINPITATANSYELSQNYPNPFNPSTKINFSILKNGFVSLKVYDISGREVANLINEELKNGAYEVNFDASYLSSGVYFYNLVSGDFNKTRQMILVK